MTGLSRFDPQQRQEDFPVASVSRPAVGPTRFPVQWVPRVLSLGVKHGWGVVLTTHPHLVPRSCMSKSYTSSPFLHLHMCVVGLLYLSIVGHMHCAVLLDTPVVQHWMDTRTLQNLSHHGWRHALFINVSHPRWKHVLLSTVTHHDYTNALCSTVSICLDTYTVQLCILPWSDTCIIQFCITLVSKSKGVYDIVCSM
jgi:hypothetical protein